MNYEEHFQSTVESRDNFWKKIGNVHPDVVGNIINPALMGGPQWPSTRQAHILVERESTSIIASDGLADPYDDYDTSEDSRSYNGVGLELYIEVKEKLTSINAVMTSWAFDVLRQISNLSAANPGLITQLKELSYLSTEVDCDKLPEKFASNGMAGVLLGLESSYVPNTLKLSIEEVQIVNVKLLTVAELDYILTHGEKGRNHIADLLSKTADPTVSDLDRPSVV